jgi:hypothetical protein
MAMTAFTITMYTIAANHHNTSMLFVFCSRGFETCRCHEKGTLASTWKAGVI